MSDNKNEDSAFLFNKTNAMRMALAFAVLATLFIITSLFIPRFNDWSGFSNIDPGLAANYGGFVGGVAGALFALVSAILLFLNFDSQEKSAARQSFEARFFQMIRLHRENVLEMVHVSPYAREEKVDRGRQVFLSMHDQYKEIYDICDGFFKDKLNNEGIADIAYLIFFFGVGEKSLNQVEHYLSNYFTDEELKELIIILREKKTNYSNNIVRFGGHQLRLGHYYRHLFNVVKYVDTNNEINTTEKYMYVKMLRAQLSTTEQAIFFYNSISELGKKWLTSGYVEKYKLIKNLPPNFVEPLKPKEYYPNITFEYEEN